MPPTFALRLSAILHLGLRVRDRLGRRSDDMRAAKPALSSHTFGDDE